MTFLLSEDKALRQLLQGMTGLTTIDYMTYSDTFVNDLGDTVTFDPDLHTRIIPKPIPVSIDYQITTYARHPRHDRELMSQILFTKLPFRFGWLEVTEKSKTVGNTTTNTNTVRRLDVINVSKRDVTEQAKRLFVNAITVRVSSEIPQETYAELYKVQQVNVYGPNSTIGRSDNPDYVSFGSSIILPPNNNI